MVSSAIRVVIQQLRSVLITPQTLCLGCSRYPRSSSTLTITVDDLNGPVHGSTTKVYQLTTSNPGGVLNMPALG
ncbi:MAG: hypothetical protein U0T82_05750 [Bacteroidales bacterium]